VPQDGRLRLSGRAAWLARSRANRRRLPPVRPEGASRLAELGELRTPPRRLLRRPHCLRQRIRTRRYSLDRVFDSLCRNIRLAAHAPSPCPLAASL